MDPKICVSSILKVTAYTRYKEVSPNIMNFFIGLFFCLFIVALVNQELPWFSRQTHLNIKNHDNLIHLFEIVLGFILGYARRCELAQSSRNTYFTEYYCFFSAWVTYSVIRIFYVDWGLVIIANHDLKKSLGRNHHLPQCLSCHKAIQARCVNRLHYYCDNKAKSWE